MANLSQPDKNALTLTPLAAADTTLVPVTPQFLQTYSDHLGNHLTSDDGFDALLYDPLSAIDADSASVDSLEGLAPDVAVLPGTFTPDALGSIAQDLGTFVEGGDTILGTTGAETTPASSPAPASGGEPTSPGVGGADGDKQPPDDNGGGIGWIDWGGVLDNIL